jgi:hypothetical protein
MRVNLIFFASQNVVNVGSCRLGPDPVLNLGGHPSCCSTETEVQPGPRGPTSSKCAAAVANRLGMTDLEHLVIHLNRAMIWDRRYNVMA